MWSIPWDKIPWISPRNLRVLLAILTGTSVLMLATGFLLNRRRRRYQAVTMAKPTHTPSMLGRKLPTVFTTRQVLKTSLGRA